MPFYQKKGKVPSKRHIQYYKDSGLLYWEELISREGFSGIYSNVYHLSPPTALEEIGESKKIDLKPSNQIHRHRHMLTSELNSEGDAITSRKPLLYNKDIIISKAHFNKSMKHYLFKNGYYDEVVFIHSGNGLFKSNFGEIAISGGDYLVIPKGIIWRIDVKEEMRALAIESSAPIETPNRYRNKFGQLLEQAPFSERDIITPSIKEPLEEQSVTVRLRTASRIQTYTYQYHPFDIIGWDGFYFPYKFNINDFMPITGKVHQPPTVHQTFKSKNFVICSFVPRLFDYHPDAIPAPYAHSNVDSDEVIYYVDGNFMSRKGIKKESITHHPIGLSHGPQPGKIEKSIGTKETNEVAVMIDTYSPLYITKYAERIDDLDYPFSWIDK